MGMKFFRRWLYQLLWVVVLFCCPSYQQAFALKTLTISAHNLAKFAKENKMTTTVKKITRKLKKTVSRDEGVVVSSRAIAVGRYLRIKAQRGDALSVEQWELVYRGWLAELEGEGAEIILRQHAYSQHLLAEHYTIVKNLTAGIPKMDYAPQFLNEMQMIINDTPFARQLQEFIDAGNLQEVVWYLDEAGLTEASIGFEKLLSHELRNGKIEQLLSNNVVKFRSGVLGFFKRNDQEFLSYKIDKLLKTKTFPLTVRRGLERVIDDKSVIESGSIQLVVENPSSMLDRQALGRKYHAYQRFIDAPSYPHKGQYLEDKIDLQRIKTLRLFTLDIDNYGAPQNRITPLRGRTFKIDGGGSDLNSFSTNQSKHYWLKELSEKPTTFYRTPEFIEHLRGISRLEIEQTVNDSAVADFLQEMIDEYLQLTNDVLEAVDASP